MLSFIKERPPLVVFFLCLLTSALTLLYFAFYVKITDPIPDTDKIYDWNQLIKHSNELDFCIQDDKFESPKNILVKMTTVQTLVNLNISEFKKFTSIHGFLTLEGWHPTCIKNNPQPSYLEILFDVPKTPDNITNIDVCVGLRGPEDYLPKFSEPNCYLNSKISDRPLLGFLTSTSAKNDMFCKGGLVSKIEFYEQEKDNFANFLSNNEKSMIYIHLLWTSYFVIFVILFMIIYAVFQSNNRLDKYLDKCANFIHHR